MKTLRIAVLALGLAVGPSVAGAEATTSQAPGATEEDGPTVAAVWVEQSLTFVYRAYTAYYSCDGLRRKVESILTEIGARPGFKVTPRACLNPRHGAEWTPTLEIVVAVPRAATPETLAEAAKQASQQELAARSAGQPSPAAEQAAEFPARLRRIEFHDSQYGLLQPGDCELIKQLSTKVFVPLGAKIVSEQRSCPFRSATGVTVPGVISMSIEILQPVATM
jgi:hypothetical protein